MNTDKVFLIRKGDTEGRLDSNFYKPDFQRITKRFKEIDAIRLKKIVTTSNEVWNGKDFFKDVFPYIEISEIEIKSGKINSFKSISKKDAPSRAKMIVRNEDILVSTTRPNRGAITFLELPDNEIRIASTGFAVLRNLINTQVKRKYLFYALRQDFSLSQMEQRSSGGNYPAITGEELFNIQIPIPPIEIQNQIVIKLERAYQSKLENEAKAINLLASIDEYLLNKLGINQPTNKETTKKTFYTNASKVISGRFDPFYYHEGYALIERALNKSSYPIVHLSSICRKITDGTHYTPTYQDAGILFLSVKNVRNERFELNDVKYISEKEHIELTKRCKPELNDILLTKIGTVGLAAVVDDSLPEFSIFVSLALLKPKQDLVNPYYISAYMNSSLAKFQSQRAVKGVGVPDWHLENIRRTEISLPPLEIQNEIVTHINNIRKEAEQLEKEAQTEIEKAKNEVEKMILGE